MEFVRIKFEICKRNKQSNFYFSDSCFSLTIQNNSEMFLPVLHNIHREGVMSQNLDLGPSFYFRI